MVWVGSLVSVGLVPESRRWQHRLFATQMASFRQGPSFLSWRYAAILPSARLSWPASRGRFAERLRLAVGQEMIQRPLRMPRGLEKRRRPSFQDLDPVSQVGRMIVQHLGRKADPKPKCSRSDFCDKILEGIGLIAEAFAKLATEP